MGFVTFSLGIGGSENADADSQVASDMGKPDQRTR